jgi:uncharacterized protein YraI
MQDDRRFPLFGAAARFLAVAAALAALPGVACAQVEAYTNQPVNLMAGPGTGYPIIVGLAPNEPVEVMDCVSTYDWCDVVLDDFRGWLPGVTLNYPYQGSDVPLESYGAVIGLPVIAFSLDTYWNRFYRNQPWYGERERWRHEGPPRPYVPGHAPVPGHGQPVPPPRGAMPPHAPQPQMPPRMAPQMAPQMQGRSYQAAPMQPQGRPMPQQPQQQPMPQPGHPPQPMQQPGRAPQPMQQPGHAPQPMSQPGREYAPMQHGEPHPQAPSQERQPPAHQEPQQGQ